MIDTSRYGGALGAVCALSSAAVAQLLPVTPAERNIEFGAATSGAVTRVVAASVSGFGVPDAVFLRGGQPYLATAPALFNGSTALSGVTGTTYDLAIAQQSAGDLVVLLGSYGLATWAMDLAGTGQFNILEAGWSTGDSLFVGDLGGDGVLDAVSVEGSLIRKRPLDGSPASAVNPGVTIHAFAVANVDLTAPGDELVAVTATEIGVITAGNFAPLATLPWAVTAATHASAVPDSGGDAVAIDAHGTSGQRAVVVFDEGSLFTLVSGLGIQGMAAGDASANGHTDLSMLRTDGSLDLLYNRRQYVLPPLPSYLYDTFWGVTSATAHTQGTSSPTQPAVADFDLDGDADVLLASETAGEMTLVRNGLFDPSTQVPDLVFDPSSGESGWVNGNTLGFRVEVPTLPNATAIEMMVWEVREDPTESTVYRMMPAATQRTLVPLVAGNTKYDLTVDISPQAPPPSLSRFTQLSGFVILVRLIDETQGTRNPATMFAHSISLWSPPTTASSGGVGLPPIPTPLPDTPPPPPPPPGSDPINGGGSGGDN